MTRAEVDRFLVWVKAEGLAASTQSTLLSTIRSVQPGNKALRLVQVKVPARSVQEELLSREEIKSVLDDLRCNEEWFYACFALWLSTGLRNAELCIPQSSAQPQGKASVEPFLIASEIVQHTLDLFPTQQLFLH